MNRISVFGECLKELLEENDYDVKTLAEKVEIKKSRIYDYLNGTHAPSLDNAVKIADFFRCSLDFLFGFCVDFQPRAYRKTGTANEQLKAAIDESGMTRYQISKITKIPQTQLLVWYHGKRQPALTSLISLAECLNCPLDYLVGRV